MEIICINIRSTHQQLSNQGSNISYSTSYVSEEKYFGQKSLKVKVNTAGEDSRCGVRQTTGNNILDTNMNAYCQNNPIMNSDPNGEWIINDAIKWIKWRFLRVWLLCRSTN